ncbi:MAG TPA: PQQ-binding-like beta-propeller repeat protein [Acetobacteraceae bacterium]|nr:PQQ-binding-like beta-propeller repeat protein [Acetobacteraceae bacterium]
MSRKDVLLVFCAPAALLAAALSASAANAQGAPGTGTQAPPPPQGQSAPASQTQAQGAPTAQDFVAAGSNNADWILPAKNYAGNRYVTSTQITPDNAGQMKPAWTFKVSDDGPMETAPIVWHGTMYVTSAHDHVYALDAATGKLKWEFQDSPHVIAFAANRGVGLMDGKVFLGTLDGHVVALDADTGKKVWDVVGVSDPKNSFYTMAPVPYHNAATGQDMLLLGVSNGDWGGIGNISAFDPKDGHRLWQWDTVPGPGEPGHDSWSGDSWKRGGASVWSGVAIDPASQTLYLDLGNPQPDFMVTVRQGDNLYSDSIVALDISGAKPTMKWYHQFIKADTHDWDPAMPPVLFQGKRSGGPADLVASGDKAGNFWLLDAKTGKLLDRTAVSFQHNQNSEPDLAGNVACPNTNGGIEYNGGAYDPDTNTFFVPSVNECGLWKSTQQAVYIAGQFYLGGIFPTYVGPNTGNFNAINVDTGVFNWRKNYNLPAAGGALVTKSGLVFTGELNGNFDAYDTKTGKLLWHYETGSSIIAPPMSFEQDGRQFVVVAAGEVGNQKVPELTRPSKGATISAFTVQ